MDDSGWIHRVSRISALISAPAKIARFRFPRFFLPPLHLAEPRRWFNANMMCFKSLKLNREAIARVSLFEKLEWIMYDFFSCMENRYREVRFFSLLFIKMLRFGIKRRKYLICVYKNLVNLDMRDKVYVSLY